MPPNTLINNTNTCFENKLYCSIILLNDEKTFDLVWHTGLSFRIAWNFPSPYYHLLKLYLINRKFLDQSQNDRSKLYSTNAGIQQESVFEPIIYTIYTTDIPTTPIITVSTFDDDTSIPAMHKNPQTVSSMLE